MWRPALHGPVQNSTSRIGFGYPAGSVIDEAVRGLPEGRTIGFRTASSPFADVPIVSNDLTSGENVTVAGFADAYVVIAPISGLTVVTPIEDFITEQNVADVVRYFPGASPTEATAADLNEFIAGNADSMSRVISEFK